MAESSSGWSPKQTAIPAQAALPASNGQSHGSDEDKITFAPEPGVNDEAPTIISKAKPPVLVETAAQDSLHNAIRGRTLAHFELIEPIGVGGMAAVLRARDKHLDRFVALKILPPEMAADPENVQRFHQEARAAAKLDHENIARVFFCGEDQRLHFIAFEYVEGDNLRAILERRGHLPVAEAVRYLLQVALGLEHAASRGVVHRDIKPSNIIITPTGRAKLVDMGLARSLERRDDKGLTQPGVTLGTFDYISPEQALEPREADVRSDIYSLGCTFYHMLTGQPSVPEGTPAKKLHHHQNVAPLDPRQLKPNIPDEVVAVLQRMMAKDPKDRYQHPLHLIQHLMQVAQKVGAAADVPEGVMFVDAPLPGPPRKRPALLVSLAALALGIVLVAISLLPPLPNNGVPLRPGTQPPKNEPGATAKENSPGTGSKNPSPTWNQDWRLVSNEKDLALALAEDRPAIKIQVANEIDITSPNLLFQGKPDRTLIIKSKDDQEPQTLRIKYQPRQELPEAWAGLQIEGGTVAFENVLFEIEGSGHTPDIPVAAVLVRKEGNVSFDRCWFVQKGFPPRSFLPEYKHMTPVASVAVDNPGNPSEKPSVRFQRCYFQEGQVAISLNGPGDISPTDCAFGPHCTLFHLRGDSKDLPSHLQLVQCSALVVRGPAFRLDNEAFCRLHVTHSLFSRPEHTPDKRYDQPDLIRQTDAQMPLVRFEGKRNCYHNLNAFWVLPTNSGSRLVTTLEEFREWVSQAKGQEDPVSSHLSAKANPWLSATPLKETGKLVFFVNPDLPEVRQIVNKHRPLGIASFLNLGAMPELHDLRSPEPVTLHTNPREKIVDPEAKGSSPSVFRRVDQAVALAEPGDVILIKHGQDREVRVDPVRLDKTKVDLTFKPYPGFNPILVLADTTEKDTALFRLHDGKLHLEGLHVRLEPKNPFKAQSVILLEGNGSCTLKHCVITLRSNLDNVPLSVVTLVDPDDTMKMAQRGLRPFPEARFQDCFVRGDGDLVTVRASRPLDMDVDNTLLALSGSAMDMTALAREVPLQPAATLRLSRVSSFLTEPFLQLRGGKNAKGLVFTRIERSRDCLFVALAGKPLVHLEGIDTSEQRMRDFLEWNADRNAYCGFDKFLEQHHADEGLMPLRLDKEGWRQFTTESDPKFVRAKFEILPWPDHSLAIALPVHFAAKAEFRAELQPFGASLDMIHLPKLNPSTPAERSPESDNSSGISDK